MRRQEPGQDAGAGPSRGAHPNSGVKRRTQRSAVKKNIAKQPSAAKKNIADYSYLIREKLDDTYRNVYLYIHNGTWDLYKS